MTDKIWIGTAIKKDELPEGINIGIITREEKIKNLFFRGLINYFEEKAKRKDDENIRKKYEEIVKQLKKSLGIL